MTGDWKPLFDRYPSTARPISPVEPLGNAGGFSGARLYRFDSARGPLLARCWPIDGPDRARLARIHDWLETAGGLGFVAVPIAALDGLRVVEIAGRSWEVAPWMPGTADLSRPPTPAHFRAGFAGLAVFLARLAPGSREGPSPGLALRSAEVEGLLAREFGQIRIRLEQAPAGAATSLAGRWLDRALPRAPSLLEATRTAAGLPLALQPCLRDARPDHFLFDGDRLSGLVDFGAMGVESVAGDLARLLAEGVGPDRSARSEALAAFEAIRPLSVAERLAIPAFERANALLAPVTWIRRHFFEGRAFDDPEAVVRGLERGLERLDETP